MRYLKMTLPALILIAVLVVALVIYPDMAKSYQERESEAAAAEQSEEQNAEAEAHPDEDASVAVEEQTSEESVLTNTAPDFEIRDAYGMNGKLSNHFGKPIVVNFWATWCPYCVQELPLFDEYAREYSGDIDFMIVDLADGNRETIEMAKKYVADYGYSFPVYFDTTGGSMYVYGITGIPVTLFIDSDGNLMTQHVGAIDEDTLLRNIQALVG